MRRSRLALLATAALLLQPGVVAGRAIDESAPTTEYIVLYATAASIGAAHDAVSAARAWSSARTSTSVSRPSGRPA
jgi:hypothetical protein